MHRFKTTPQNFKEIVLSGLALYWEGIKTLWIWSLVLAVLSNIPDWIMSYFIRNQYSMKVLITFDILALVFVPVLVFFISYINYRLFLLGSQTKKTDDAIFKIIFDKIFLLSGALLTTVIVSAVGLGLFIVPGLFLGVMLIFVQPLILFDDNSFVEAFKNSWMLVQKNWWHIFSVLAIPLILFYIAVPSVYSGSPSVFLILFDILRMAFVIPLLFAFVLTMFYDAKARHHVPMHLPRAKKTIGKATSHASAKGE